MPGSNDEMLHEAFAYAEEQSPSLLFFEDLDSMIDQTVLRSRNMSTYAPGKLL